ncbi:hypothetical protein D3C86_2146970 [compost metagenome]
MRVQVMRHHPVVLVVRLFSVAQNKATGVDVGRTDDLYAILAQGLQAWNDSRGDRAVAGAGVDDGFGA